MKYESKSINTIFSKYFKQITIVQYKFLYIRTPFTRSSSSFFVTKLKTKLRIITPVPKLAYT